MAVWILARLTTTVPLNVLAEGNLFRNLDYTYILWGSFLVTLLRLSRPFLVCVFPLFLELLFLIIVLGLLEEEEKCLPWYLFQKRPLDPCLWSYEIGQCYLWSLGAFTSAANQDHGCILVLCIKIFNVIKRSLPVI